MKFIGFYDYTVILTYLSLLSACSGMVLASRERFTAAVLCLLVSGICDAVSFGVFPAVLCYFIGVDGIPGLLILFAYCLCAVIRLAFFNVLEGNRQKVESGCNKSYRGLPVTSVSILLPIVWLLRGLLPVHTFLGLLHAVMAVTAFLFVLDFSVKKPDWSRLVIRSR